MFLKPETYRQVIYAILFVNIWSVLIFFIKGVFWGLSIVTITLLGYYLLFAKASDKVFTFVCVLISIINLIIGLFALYITTFAQYR